MQVSVLVKNLNRPDLSKAKRKGMCRLIGEHEREDELIRVQSSFEGDDSWDIVFGCRFTLLL